jgi:uncharacterized protein
MRNFFLLIVLFFVTQWLLKKLRRANARAQADAPGSTRTAGDGPTRARSGTAKASPPPQLADPLIRCAQCGVHTPRSESIAVAGERFCCSDHARRYSARPTGRDAR